MLIKNGIKAREKFEDAEVLVSAHTNTMKRHVGRVGQKFKFIGKRIKILIFDQKN